jgi:hypothetical protein
MAGSETTINGKYGPSTFRLYPIYTYDGPTPGPEIALEKDHAKRENIDINMLPDQTFGQRCLVIQMVGSCIPSSRTPQPLEIS